MRTRFLRALAVVAVVACSDSTEPTAVVTDLAEAKRRWAASAPTSYQYTFARACFCGTEYTRPVSVTVRNGTVQSVRYADTGVPLTPALAAGFTTIEGVFALVDDAIAKHAASVTAEYDAARGYPLHIFIDFIASAADDEMGYGIRDFVAF
jgi:hypothetical protein